MGPCCDSVFIRDCKNVTITVACKQVCGLGVVSGVLVCMVCLCASSQYSKAYCFYHNNRVWEMLEQHVIKGAQRAVC